MNIRKSYAGAINTTSFAVADFARSIKYHSSVGEPDLDLIEELKRLYEQEKERLEMLWRKVAKKGKDFLEAIRDMVADFFEELVSDLMAFLKKHGLEFIVELIKKILG